MKNKFPHRSIIVLVVLVCLASIRSDGQSVPGSIVVSFKEGTSDSEARWILRSYKVKFDLYSQHVFGLLLIDDTQDSREKIETFTGNLNREHTLGRSVIVKTRDQPLAPDQTTFRVYGDLQHDSALQDKFISLLPSGIVPKWLIEPPTATISVVPGTENEWLAIWKSEPDVAFADYQAWPAQTSVQTSTTIRGEPEQDVKPATGKRPKSTQIPKRAAISGSQLPTIEWVSDVFNGFYAKGHSRISLVSNDSDEGGEFFEFLIENVKGTVTKENYWEKLRYSLIIYRSNAAEIKIRCVMDGQFAAGVGPNEPSDSSFQDLEPIYTRKMQDEVGRFMQGLVVNLQKRERHD
ncbi:hypothetical protein [Tunturiibacter psychrotolerans]|uniref:hypothetical protein n=1 Tax=Tunturiibacter psychrotolerans TaxID=3069686 RepID=UPI003D2125E3